MFMGGQNMFHSCSWRRRCGTGKGGWALCRGGAIRGCTCVAVRCPPSARNAHRSLQSLVRAAQPFARPRSRQNRQILRRKQKATCLSYGSRGCCVSPLAPLSRPASLPHMSRAHQALPPSHVTCSPGAPLQQLPHIVQEKRRPSRANQGSMETGEAWRGVASGRIAGAPASSTPAARQSSCIVTVNRPLLCSSKHIKKNYFYKMQAFARAQRDYLNVIWKKLVQASLRRLFGQVAVAGPAVQPGGTPIHGTASAARERDGAARGLRFR